MCIRDRGLPFRRHLPRLSLSINKLDIKLFFEFLQAHTQRRLRNVQGFRRLADLSLSLIHILLDAREARLPGTIMTTYQQEETGFIEALVAVYEPACLPWFDAAWEQGIRKFSVVIPEELRTHVPYARSEALPFFNINYPADFEIARRLAELMRRDGM